MTQQQASGRTRRTVRGVALFLLAWMVVPSLFRFGAFACLVPEFGNLRAAALTGGWVLLAALPQDLFIAVEALVLAALLRPLLGRLSPRRAALASAALLTVLFAAVHFYLLFDFLLYNKTSIRMDPAFLDFLPVASSFASSVSPGSLMVLAGGLLGILVSLRVVYRVLRRTTRSLRPTWWLLPALPAVAVLAVASRTCMPAQVGYAVDNLILNDQVRLVSRLAGHGAGLSPADESFARELLRPRAERFEPVSEECPLLKRTEGFTGPRQFELDIRPGERPHVVFLFLESFRGVDVGALGARHGATPQFDRLARQGVLFTNFYGNGVQTTRGVIASLFGIVPCFSSRAVQAGNPELPLVGVADLLNRRGYTSGYLTGTSLSFEAQDRFFAAHGYQEVLGDRDIARAFPDAQRTSWGYHDEYLVRYAADWLAEKDRRGQPAFATIFTITNHHPWQLPDDYEAPDFPTAANPEHGRFLRTLYYSDHCLGLFMDLLHQRGLDRRTVVFVLADTGTPQGEHHDNFMVVNYLYEENMRIPLLILAPGHIRRPTVVGDVGSQVDLLPTVMDLFGLTGLNHAVGTSLVRRVEGRTAWFNNPFAIQYRGLRRDHLKYVYALGSRTSSLYDLQFDPGERHNLASAMPERVRRFDAEAAAVHPFFLKLYLTERFISRDLLDQMRSEPDPAPEPVAP